jgi:poly-gamma-glutamate capsule biosynthesis protein CapA/YwtB (metallophosphatase superfamily)
VAKGKKTLAADLVLAQAERQRDLIETVSTTSQPPASPGPDSQREPARRIPGLLALVVTVGTLVAVSALMLRDSKPDTPVSLAFVGDIMLGRGVAPIAGGDPSGLFEEVRWILRSSDLTLGNLESPLTMREHRSLSPYSLRADPSTASLLADAGFDVLSLANNHVGDAGPGGVLDTIEAIESVDMMAVGAGPDRSTAREPLIVDVDGLRISILAFDATRAGLAAGVAPGVVGWDERAAERAVRSASGRSSLVVVSLHGGVEYLPEPDPRMLRLAEKLTTWGADIIWGHGAHVVQPVLVEPGRHPTLTATSLGNFLFDQRGPLTGQGAVLEVMADRAGLIAYRVGVTSHSDLRVRWMGWELPEGDAVLIEGEWWGLMRRVQPRRAVTPPIDDFRWGSVVAAASGRVTGEDLETVISFRQIPGSHPVRAGFPSVQWVDADGMSPHLGIYQAHDLTPVWVAGMVPGPVAELAACDGAVALAYSELDDPSVVATGAAVWRPFGLVAAERLPGWGQPGCADVDGDGSTEPVILQRDASGG